MNAFRSLVLSFVPLLAGFSAAPADIVCVAPTDSAPGMLQITTPITFTATTAATVSYFVLSGWVTSDGSRTQPTLSPSLAYAINGNTSPLSITTNFTDNLATGTLGSIGPNDGYIGFTNGVVVLQPGSTVTLLAGNYTMPATANFNPQATQTFTGAMYAANSNGTRVSAITAAPEPSA